MKPVTDAATANVPENGHEPFKILGGRSVPIKDIKIDDWILPRLLHEEVVDEYVEALEGSASLPPITVIELDGFLFLVDGRHRLTSHEKLGHKEINVRVMDGTKQDALLAAILLNGTHGHKLTREEVREAIRKALRVPELRGLANTELARRIGTSHKTVERVRKSLAKVKSTESETIADTEPVSTVTYTTKNGDRTRKAHNKKSKNRTAIPAWLSSFQTAAKAVPADDELTALLEDGSLVATFNRVAGVVFTAAQRLSNAAYYKKGGLTEPEMLPVDQPLAEPTCLTIPDTTDQVVVANA